MWGEKAEDGQCGTYWGGEAASPTRKRILKKVIHLNGPYRERVREKKGEIGFMAAKEKNGGRKPNLARSKSNKTNTQPRCPEMNSEKLETPSTDRT